MKNSQIAQTLRTLRLNASLESESGEGVVSAQLEPAQETPADGAGAPGEDKEITAKTVEVGERSELESAATEVKPEQEIEAATTTVEDAENLTTSTESVEGEQTTVTGDGEAVVKADLEPAQELQADAHIGEAEDKDLTAKSVEVGERSDLESAETEVEGSSVESAETTSEVTVSQEGIAGTLMGFILGASGWIPGPGWVAHGVAKSFRLKLQQDIEDISKRIAKVREGQIAEVEKDGVKLPAKLRETHWVEIVKGAVLGQFFGPFYGAHQGNQLENLNADLKKKIAELSELLEKEKSANKVSQESVEDGAQEVADAAAAFAAGAAATAEAASAAADNAEGAAGETVEEAAVEEVVEVAADADAVEEIPADEDEAIAEGESEIAEAEEAVSELENHAEVYEKESATLESLIDALRDAQATGGLTPQAARIFNIGFESIGIHLTGAPIVDATGGSPIPSLESYGGSMTRRDATQVSLEAAEGLAAQIWEVIKATWAKIVEWLKQFAAAVFSQAARYKQRAEKLKAAVKGAGSKKAKVSTFKYSGISKIAVGKKIDLNKLALLKNIGDTAGTQSSQTQALTDALVSLANKGTQAVMSATSFEEILKNLEPVLESSEVAHITQAMKGSDHLRSIFKNVKSEGMVDTYSTDVFPGNVVLTAAIVNEKGIDTAAQNAQDGAGVASFIGKLFMANVKVRRITTTHQDVEFSDADMTVPVLSLQDIAKVADQVLEVLEAVEKGRAGMEKLQAEIRGSVSIPPAAHSLVKITLKAYAKSISKSMTDYNSGTSKLLKYSVGASGGFLDYAVASFKQYAGADAPAAAEA